MKKNLAIAIFCWLVLFVAPLISQGKIARKRCARETRIASAAMPCPGSPLKVRSQVVSGSDSGSAMALLFAARASCAGDLIRAPTGVAPVPR